jgi:hypothetical protein
MILLSMACAIPGFPGAQMTPFPTFDPNAPGTIIAETAAAAQTQTALKLPTSTITPLPTRTASITPTYTPTFLWALPTLTPIPTNTLPPTFTLTPKQANAGGSDEDDGESGPKKKDEDPRKFTGKQWSCVVVGTYPPRNTVFKAGVTFVVQWTVFNSGTSAWGYNDLDFVWKSGYRHEETKIQDFPKSVPSGGEVNLTATFIAPKNEGEYQTFFHLTVGNKDFCGAYYVFKVIK